jgi:CheY-like chemotaxis protein
MRSAAEQGQPFSAVLIDTDMPDRDGFDVALEIRNSYGLGACVIPMLRTSRRQPSTEPKLQEGHVARCRDLDFAAYLTKPVRRKELRAALTRTLTSHGELLRLEERLPKTSIDVVSETAPLRILLVEDNPVNQRLATRMLEKEGHGVVVAGNGKEAIAAWLKQPFDLILMDIQMPEMDGLQATRAIRRAEAGLNQHIPIVAVTAHAMSGDRERCLAAGMDDYISKPIRKSDLLEMIGKHTIGAGAFEMAPACAP